MDTDALLARGDVPELAAWSAVGRIESPPGTARGTGVLVDRQLLLTCKHIFKRIFDCGLDRAWVRFGYKTGKDGVEPGDIFELDLKAIVSDNAHSDYALVRICGEPEYCIAPLSNAWLKTKQGVRIIHHPRGEPAQISEIGQIVNVDKDYIQHDLKADFGSSGAPIFDLDWHVVAIHRGRLSLSRSYAPGVTEGVPIYSIWKDIKSYSPTFLTFKE